MKKVLAVILAAAMVLSLAGCGAPAAQEQKEAAPAATEAAKEEAKAEEAAPAAEAAPAEEAAPAAKEGPIKIGFVNMSSGNPVFYDLELGVKETAAKMGIDVEWVAPATADAVQQATLVEQISNTGIDALAVVPYTQQLETSMKAASEKGIPVAQVSGSNISYADLAFTVGTDQYGVGNDVGKLAAQKLDPTHTYKIGVITDLGGGEAFELRIEGFEDALKEAGIPYEIIGTFSCEDDITKAVEAVESFTATSEDLDFWFFAGGWPLMTDTSALPNLKKWHEEDGHWCFSVDAFPPMEAFFEEGICDGCSGQFYYNMGQLTVEYLAKLINGEALPTPDSTLAAGDPFYSSGTLAVPAENYKEVFSQMTPWN